MKNGIIIIFCDNEHQIEKHQLVEFFRTLDRTQICLVNNESKDNTLECPYDIKDYTGMSVSVVDIKKKFPIELAEKAGKRFLSNQSNLKNVKCLDVSANKFSSTEISMKIKEITNCLEMKASIL